MTKPVKKLTPMMRQYNELKSQYPDSILFFRMGDFYEMFGDDAVKAAPILDVVLTSRDKNSEDKMPMCGIPHHAIDTYIQRLIEKNYKVAICEQLEDPKQAKGIVKRGVVRLITPGTILEENLLTARENNFLGAVFSRKKHCGLAFLDMSTGEFKVTEIEVQATGIETELERWSVREVIVCESEPDLSLIGSVRVSVQDDWIYTSDYATDQIRELLGVSHLDGYGLEEMPAATIAAGALIHYIRGTQIDALGHITGIQTYHNESVVHLDSASRRNLEITRTLMGNQRDGSLLSYLDESVTPMGSRLLKQRLEQPLRDIHTINDRLDLVEGFYHETGLRLSIREQLRGVADLERLASRIATGIATPRDLGTLRSSLQQIPSLKLKLINTDNDSISALGTAIEANEDVRTHLESALADEPPASMKDGGIIKTGFNPELDSLRLAARDGKLWIAALQAQERDATGISSLKVRYNKVFGYFIEVTKTHLSKIPEHYIRRQTLANCERFVTPELKEMEEKILGSEDKMVSLENQLFRQIRTDIAEHTQALQRLAKTIARLDIAASSAETALNQRYRRPVLTIEQNLDIVNGRHPVVERIPSDRGFVANDTRLNSDDTRLIILTGPNMAGKSTFIRQVALIVLMAQCGLFVPADEAVIGIVDRIFTRVGASDNLAGGQSTFMVEMSEAANILNNATRSSLVILDEIGRGTSTFDGLSIAWAVAEYLHDVQCRTLFATHYHELTELKDRLDGIDNYNVVVKEWNDEVMFMRKVVKGAVDRSYGIQVARLAGLPVSVLNRAKEVLRALEMKEQGRVPESIHEKEDHGPIQLSLFSGSFSPLQKALDHIDVNQITPMEALNIISKWKADFSS